MIDSCKMGFKQQAKVRTFLMEDRNKLKLLAKSSTKNRRIEFSKKQKALYLSQAPNNSCSSFHFSVEYWMDISQVSDFDQFMYRIFGK